MTGNVFTILAACVALAVAAGGPAVPGALAQDAPTTLSLAQAVSLALQQNQQLRVAAFEVQIARAQLAQAQAGAGPTLNTKASYTRIKDQPPTSFTFGAITVTLPAPSSDIYDGRLILSYPLFTGGRLEAPIALAQANLKGAEATFARVGQQIVFNVRQAYYQHLLGQAGVDVAR